MTEQERMEKIREIQELRQSSQTFRARLSEQAKRLESSTPERKRESKPQPKLSDIEDLI